MASYEQIGKKRLWSVRFREIGADGLEHNARLSGFRTKKEAERAYLERVHDRENAPKPPDKNDPLFSDLVAEFLAFKDRRVKESSYVDMVSAFKKQITPTFGKMMVRQIRPLDIERWQAERANLSPAYREKLRTYLGAILQYASDYYDAPNQIKKVPPLRDKTADKVKQEKDEDKHYEPDQLSALLSACDEEPYHTLLWCIAYLGCRKGEATALLWSDVDERDRVVHITKTVTKKTKDYAYTITTPKSKSSVRDIPVSDAFLARMREYRAWQQKNAPGAFVFAGERPIPEKSIDNKFRDAARQAGVPILSTKALRHTCVSLLHSRGVDWIVISRRLGHASVKITMDIYAHMLRADEDNSRSVLDDI